MLKLALASSAGCASAHTRQPKKIMILPIIARKNVFLHNKADAGGETLLATGFTRGYIVTLAARVEDVWPLG